MVLALLFFFLRLRYTWWPLHPVIFLVWATWPMRNLSASFLLGWIIKALVVRLAGAVKYKDLKVLMIGVIAGDLLAGLLFMCQGAIYYAIHDILPKPYTIMPG